MEKASQNTKIRTPGHAMNKAGRGIDDYPYTSYKYMCFVKYVLKYFCILLLLLCSLCFVSFIYF